MYLKDKETGSLYKIKAGFILNEANAKKFNVDGSFLTLISLDSEEEVLYTWKYWADNKYETYEGELDGRHENDLGSGSATENSTTSGGTDDTAVELPVGINSNDGRGAQ